jgi:hypothetical protein
MTQSADQIVREYRKASRRLRPQLRDPEKAKGLSFSSALASTRKATHLRAASVSPSASVDQA